jgi:hypothetical protein
MTSHIRVSRKIVIRVTRTEDRAALVVAHPGHELRVFGWLEKVRPRVFVLTDGSGRTGRSRLQSTTDILAGVGALPGSVYGRFSDLALYQAILQHDYQLFAGLARELADEFLRQRIEYAAGDSAEGYNTMHDVCRLVLDAALEMVGRAREMSIGNYDFHLKGRLDECPAPLRDRAIWLHLDDAAVGRKLKAANDYPEMADEVEAAISENDAGAFRIECLRPVEGNNGIERFATEKPYYEKHGEQQMAAGYYKHVIRYREHMLPLAEALQESIGGNCR